MAILARVNRIIGARDVDMESCVVVESRADEDFGEAVSRDDVPRDHGGGDSGGKGSDRMGLAASEKVVVAPGAEIVAMDSSVSTSKTKR